jgi:hypothetical protein
MTGDLEYRLRHAGYKAGRVWRRVKRAVLLRDARMFIQRGRRGFCDEDVWGFDCYIARVMSSGIARLADTDHGWPCGDKWPTYEDWVRYLRDLAGRLGHWTDKNFADQDAFEVTRSAVEEFGRNFGHFWD